MKLTEGVSLVMDNWKWHCNRKGNWMRIFVHKNLIVARPKTFNSISFISVPKIFILLQRFTSIFIKQIKRILSLILNILKFIYNSKKNNNKKNFAQMLVWVSCLLLGHLYYVWERKLKFAQMQSNYLSIILS